MKPVTLFGWRVMLSAGRGARIDLTGETPVSSVTQNAVTRGSERLSTCAWPEDYNYP